jgi:hypothetical protein
MDGGWGQAIFVKNRDQLLRLEFGLTQPLLSHGKKSRAGGSDVANVYRRHGPSRTRSGFHVTFIKDAVADFTEAAHEAALTISYPTFGHDVLTVTEFLESAGTMAA